MRLLIVTDAWYPQVNGVVRTIATTRDKLLEMGNEVEVISPDVFTTLPCPTYPEIRLALFPQHYIGRRIRETQPNAIHISTEGPLGLATRRYCIRHDLPFTTSFHTRFPEYVKARIGLPLSWGYGFLRWFHRPSSAVMVATESLKEELAARGFQNMVRWSRGVDLSLFNPGQIPDLGVERPVFLYVGRVAVEKNIETFLDLDLPGTKVVVGDGPLLKSLSDRYPAVRFLGALHGEDLVNHYAAADVFVFPSRTDTFGLVVVEALACGVPVAAFPVPGPKDIIGDSGAGALDEDLTRACLACLDIDRTLCRQHALQFSWEACATQFLNNLAPFTTGQVDLAPLS